MLSMTGTTIRAFEVEENHATKKLKVESVEPAGEYCPYGETSKAYDLTRKPLGLGIVFGALMQHGEETPLSQQRLFDVGCGTGTFLEAVVGHVGEVVGADFSEGMLSQAKAKSALKSKGVMLSQGSANKLEEPDVSFDCVISNQVIHHFPKDGDMSFLSEYVQEAFRVLKPGGCFIIHTSSPEQQRDAFWWLALFPKASDSICARFPEIEVLVAKMREAGFVVNADAVTVPIGRTLMDNEIYLKNGLDSGFDAQYRAGDSSWAMAENSGELEAGLARIREMQKAGTATAWLKEREVLRNRIGQATFVVARKPSSRSDSEPGCN